MNQALTVQEVKTSASLNEVVERLYLRKLLLIPNDEEEVPLLSIFQEQINVATRSILHFNSSVESHYVLMIDPLVNVNFAH